MTIMAMSLRAAEHVERRLDEPRAAVRSKRRRGLAFNETMGGELVLCRGPRAGERVHAEFRVRASPDSAKRSSPLRLVLDGVVDLPGVVCGARCAGTLTMRPLARRGTLVYDLSFSDADGAPLRLHGEKSVGLRAPLRGMTELDTEVTDTDERIVASGQLRFELRDLPRWLGSFRVA